MCVCVCVLGGGLGMYHLPSNVQEIHFGTKDAIHRDIIIVVFTTKPFD